MKKTMAVCAWIAASLLPGMQASHAASYPEKPIRLIVPFAPGGAVDQVARTMSHKLSGALGQPVVVENRAGASGALGAAEVARAPADGYTLGLVLDSHAVNHYTVKKLQYDTYRSFDYLSLLVTLPQVLVARKSFPPNTVDELAQYISTHDTVSYGSAGTASAGHINSATMAEHYKVTPTHIPYGGAGPLLGDLLGGHIDFAFAGLSVMLPQIEAGSLKAIAISTAERSPKLPDVPTVSQTIPGFEIPTWVGLLAPAGLKPEVKSRILAAVAETMQDNDVRGKLEASAFRIVASSPDEFVERVRKDDANMAQLIKAGVIKLD